MKIADESPVRELRSRLMRWYGSAARDLPWRKNAVPYSVFVSEFMLQQTRAAVVVPYFQRWMKRFPTVEALAAASPEEVLKTWEGLGYYSRARNLHRAAKTVCERHAGRFPRETAALKALPGVGDYTAGAVASIAFGRPVPAVDGNAVRVLARIFAVKARTDRAEGKKAIVRAATALVQGKNPGKFNQALMELGAVVCKPRNPDCPRCPLDRFCRARQEGNPVRYPVAKSAAMRPVKRGVCLVALHGGKTLIRQRKKEGLLSGFWEFPVHYLEEAQIPSETLARKFWENLLGVRAPKNALPLPRTNFQYSHFKLELIPYLIENPKPAMAETEAGNGLLWIPPRRIGEKPFSKAHRKTLEWLLESMEAKESGL